MEQVHAGVAAQAAGIIMVAMHREDGQGHVHVGVLMNQKKLSYVSTALQLALDGVRKIQTEQTTVTTHLIRVYPPYRCLPAS